MTSPDYSPSEPIHGQNFLADLWDTRTARVLSTALLLMTALVFLHGVRETLTLFICAILFSYFLAPAVSKLQEVLHGRGKAILVVYAVLGVLVAGLGFIIGPSIADEGRQLVESLPSLLDRLGSGQLVAELGQHYHWKQLRVQQIQTF